MNGARDSTGKFFESGATPDPRKWHLENCQEGIFYYANACHVCHVFENEAGKFTIKRCVRCNFVSYCSSSHQKLDWANHKDLCKAIYNVKNYLKQDYVFHLLKASNNPNKPISTIVNEAKARVEFKAKLMALTAEKLKREFYPEELQMFNHPRVCTACFECDPAFLTNCPKCPQATFCQKHLQNSDHQEICPKLLTAFIIESNAHTFQEIIESIKEVKTDLQKEATELPSSIQKFIETYVQESEIKDLDTEEQLTIKISIISERLSMALSLLFAIEKLKYTPGSQMTVHLFGATIEETIMSSDWEIILHWLPQLFDLNLVLISPNILLGDEQIVYSVCNLCKENKKNLVVEVKTSHYEEYFKSPNYKKPDIITAFNVNICAYPFWDKAMPIVRSLSCPFLITSYNQIEAYRNQEKISSMFGCAKCIYFQPNPFASMIYMRSFVDEGVCSKNYFMLLYKSVGFKV